MDSLGISFPKARQVRQIENRRFMFLNPATVFPGGQPIPLMSVLMHETLTRRQLRASFRSVTRNGKTPSFERF